MRTAVDSEDRDPVETYRARWRAAMDRVAATLRAAGRIGGRR
jgi:hypothetical protein